MLLFIKYNTNNRKIALYTLLKSVTTIIHEKSMMDFVRFDASKVYCMWKHYCVIIGFSSS